MKSIKDKLENQVYDALYGEVINQIEYHIVALIFNQLEDRIYKTTIFYQLDNQLSNL